MTPSRADYEPERIDDHAAVDHDGCAAVPQSYGSVSTSAPGRPRPSDPSSRAGIAGHHRLTQHVRNDRIPGQPKWRSEPLDDLPFRANPE